MLKPTLPADAGGTPIGDMPALGWEPEDVAQAPVQYAQADTTAAWSTVSALPGQEAAIATDGEAAVWTDVAIVLGFVCVALAWLAHLRRYPSSLDRTGVRRRPPLVDLDEVLED